MRSGVRVAEAKCNGVLNSAILYLRQHEIEGCDQSIKILVFTSEFTVLLLAVGRTFVKSCELLFLCVSSKPVVQEVSREWRL